MNDGVYHQTVEDIEQGKDSGERLHLVRYTDGDIEHLTADQVRQWSRTVENEKDNGEPTQKSIDFVNMILPWAGRQAPSLLCVVSRSVGTATPARGTKGPCASSATARHLPTSMSRLPR